MDGTERVVEQVVIPRLQMSGRVVEQIVIPHAQESECVVEQIVPVLSFQQFEEDGVDVAQFIPQERMQCTVEQIVGVTVLQIMEDAVGVVEFIPQERANQAREQNKGDSACAS